MQTSLIDIFLLFLKVGLQLLGGGYVILPILKHEVVENRKWITEEELLDYYAISQCTPGVIAVNVSLFIGYKQRGILGALAALLGKILPSFLIIIFLATLLINHMHNKFLQNAFWGIRIGVIMLILLTIKEFLGNCIKTRFSKCLYIFILIITLFTNTSPILLIVTAAIIGLIHNKFEAKAY